jgi:uncharacterized membrane protein
MASTLGKKSTRSLMIVSAVIIYLMAILQFMVFGVDRYSPYVLILAGMATILLLILLLPSYFRNRDTFRIAADAVLLMGFLTLLIRV